MTARLRLKRDWKKRLAAAAAVKQGEKRLADAIAEDAQSRTAKRTGAAAESVMVVEKDGKTYVVGGAGAWWYVFQELGGQGFRPPPMPIRRAASKYGVRTSKE